MPLPVLETAVTEFAAIKNGNLGDSQNLRWTALTSLVAFNILGFSGPDTPGGDPPVVCTLDSPPLACGNIILRQMNLTADIDVGTNTGMMVLEEDDYIEVAADVASGFLLDIPSLKVVRVGIGNFL